MSDDLFEFVRKFRPFGLKPLSSRDRVRDLLKFAKRRSGLKKDETLFDVGDPSVSDLNFCTKMSILSLSLQTNINMHYTHHF